VHVEEEPYSLAALQLALLARRFGARFSFFSWENLERRTWPFGRVVERTTCAIAASAIAGNTGAHDRLSRRLAGKHIAVVPQLGVAIPACARSQSAEPPLRVAFAGRLVESKGVLDLVAAVRDGSLFRLTVIGSGPLKPELIQRGVRVIGPLSHREVERSLLDQDVLVLPSHSTLSWSEQFGHVLIEAMAAGAIPVGSSSGAIPEVIRNHDLIYPERNVPALTSLLTGLARDYRRRVQLGSSFRARAEREYSHDAVARRTAAALGLSG
jgi:glycosyltransferase involved in cell wall biosynthesis